MTTTLIAVCKKELDPERDPNNYIERRVQFQFQDDEIIIFLMDPEDPDEDEYGEIKLTLVETGSWILKASDLFRNEVQIRFNEESHG